MSQIGSYFFLKGQNSDFQICNLLMLEDVLFGHYIPQTELATFLGIWDCILK